MSKSPFTPQLRPGDKKEIRKEGREIKVLKFWEGHKFCKISTVDLSYVVTVKSKVEISQNFVAFSEYMNFTSRFKKN